MVTIRRAAVADAAAIAEVHVETWRDTYAGLVPSRVLVGMRRRHKAAMWSQALDRRRTRQVVMVAEDDAGAVVGFGSCGPAKGVDLDFDGEVYTLYVLPDYQGRGIGARLLAGLFEALLVGGSRSALIWVLAGNPARFFYQTAGGAWIAVREERLWGATLREMAYGWDDLEQAVAVLLSHPAT